ncbi:pentapeptide repeat-containing protein [Myxococcaceae bacterium JPH2]|nr:pentapeptide repeat-containing protein [Myxococcaceae bacterium JPH2]
MSRTPLDSSARVVYGATRFNAPGSFSGLAFSSDSRELSVLADDTRLLTFSVEDGALVDERVLDVGRSLFCLPDGDVITSTWGQARRLKPSGRMAWKVGTLDNKLGNVSVSPDGTRLITFGEEQDTRVWDVETGALLHTLPPEDGQLYAAAFSADGAWLATGSSRGMVRVFDARTGKERAKRKRTKVLALAFSPDGSLLLSGHGVGDVRLWEVPGLAPRAGFTGQHTFEATGASGGAGCRWVAFSPDGARAYSLGNERWVRVWSVDSGEELSHLTVPRRHAQGSSTALSPDGKWLATGSTDGALSVWSTEDGQPCTGDAAPTDIEGLALTARAVSAASRSTCVTWERATGKRSEIPTTFPPTDVKGLASGEWVRLDYDSVFVGELLGEESLPAFQLGTYASGPLALSRSQTWIAASADHDVEVWDVQRKVRVATLTHDARVQACAFGPQDAWLVSVDTAVRIWSLVGTPRLLRSIPLKAGGVARGLAVSARGWIAVSFDEDVNHYHARCAILVVDPRDGAVVSRLARPRLRLGQVAFVGEGTRLAVTGSGGRLLLADVAQARWHDAPEEARDEEEEPTRREELGAHPLAVDGNHVAFIGEDRSVAVIELDAVAREAGEPFLLESETRVVVPAEPVRLFEQRLAGHHFFFEGRFKQASKALREVTVKELGGAVVAKPGPVVTDVARGELGKGKPKAGVPTKARVLSEEVLIRLLLPTREEAFAMLRGEVEDGLGRWNAWRERFRRDLGERFPVPLTGIDLSGRRLSEAMLDVMDFREAKLVGTDFSDVNLFDADFRGADMRGANLSRAHCYRAIFTLADLREAKLSADLMTTRFDGADLRGADLSDANLDYANLSGADLRDARLPANARDVKHDAKTRWPKGAGPW